MITTDQARLILANMQPHTLHADSKQPITPNFFHLTEKRLKRLQINESDLKGHDFYDGPEHIYKGRVHVFEKNKLEAFVGIERADCNAR